MLEVTNGESAMAFGRMLMAAMTPEPRSAASPARSFAESGRTDAAGCAVLHRARWGGTTLKPWESICWLYLQGNTNSGISQVVQDFVKMLDPHLE